MLIQPVLLSLLTINLRFSDGNSIGNQRKFSIIVDFLNLQKPSLSTIRIYSFLCWKKEISVIKQLSSQYRLATIKSLENFKNSSKFEHHQYFLVDLSCENSQEILQKAENLKLFDAPFSWIIIQSTPNNRTDQNLKISPKIGSRVFLINSTINNSYEIKAIYKLNKTVDDFIENPISQWTEQHGFQHFNELIISKNRTNLMGYKFVGSYVLTNLDSLNHLWDYRQRHVDSISKANYILIHHLIDILNATREFKLQRTWGYKNQTTGKYNGIVGDLLDDKCDIGATPMFFSIERQSLIEFIAMTTPTYMKFIFRSPPLSYVTNVFTLPFDRTVWHYCFTMVVVVLLCLYIITLWEWKEPVFRRKIEEQHNSLRPDIFDVAMMEIGAISQQGTDNEPKSISGRIAMIFTFLSLTFLYTAYSASIVALLQSTTDSIRTVEDLLTSRIKLGVEDIVYAHYYFETVQEPIRRAVYNQKIAPKGQKANFMPLEEGIRRVQQTFFGFHVELSTGYKVIGDIFQESEKCALKEIEFFNLLPPWIAIQKNSPYREILKVGMKKIDESGIRQREIRRFYTRKPVCHSKGSNFGSVGIIECYSAFLFFIIGIGISIVLFFMEIFVKKYKTKKETTLNKVIEIDYDGDRDENHRSTIMNEINFEENNDDIKY